MNIFNWIVTAFSDTIAIGYFLGACIGLLVFVLNLLKIKHDNDNFDYDAIINDMDAKKKSQQGMNLLAQRIFLSVFIFIVSIIMFFLRVKEIANK